jgi:hypothetical protein
MEPKLAVLPLSAMVSSWWIVQVAGPIAIGAFNVDDNKKVEVDEDELIRLLSTFLAAIGLPPCQLLVWAPGRLGLAPAAHD